MEETLWRLPTGPNGVSVETTDYKAVRKFQGSDNKKNPEKEPPKKVARPCLTTASGAAISGI